MGVVERWLTVFCQSEIVLAFKCLRVLIEDFSVDCSGRFIFDVIFVNNFHCNSTIHAVVIYNTDVCRCNTALYTVVCGRFRF